jgi:hypothetical protein
VDDWRACHEIEGGVSHPRDGRFRAVRKISPQFWHRPSSRSAARDAAAPAAAPTPIRKSSSRNASARRRCYSAPPKRPSVLPARCAEANSRPLAVPSAILAPHRRVSAIPSFARYHAAQGEKAGHSREKSPKRHIDSHVTILHGRPRSINRAAGSSAPCSNVAAAKRTSRRFRFPEFMTGHPGCVRAGPGS